jgi:hypothetical protein
MNGAIKMKRIALAVAIASSALSIAAYDLTGSGFTQKGERNEDGKTIAILADEAGTEVLFSAENDPSAQRLSALHALVAELRSWKNFQAAEIRAVNTDDRLQVTAIPRSFKVGGVALDQAVPGGIQLYYKTATEYDFKIRSGKYIVRVASVFTGETDLEAAALAAYKDPASFIATRDPLYVQRRLDELSARADDLAAKTDSLATKANSLSAKTDTLATRADGLAAKSDGLVTKATSFAAQANDLDARISAIEKVTFDTSSGIKEERTSRVEKEVEAVKADLQAAKAKLDENQAKADAQRNADWERTKPILLQALNGGKAINKAAMDKLVELKKADPSLDKKNAPKALKTAGFTISATEIAAIYLVEFGEP